MSQPDSSTQLTAVLGHPIAHTLSPLIHNAAFSAQGLPYAYLAFDVKPDELPTAIRGLRTLGFAGANITIPHKRAVSALVDELTPAAQAVGAVNTVVPVERGGTTEVLMGDNTDVEGFLAPLASQIDTSRHTSSVVFGAGGAARAVVYALLTGIQSSDITVIARKPERAEALCEAMDKWSNGVSLRWCSPSNASDAVARASLVVNCTPVGMAPRTTNSVWSDPKAVHSDQLWYDLIYNPVDTSFLRLASERGASTISGLEMFIAQAAASYRQWTNREMPVDVVRAALKQWFK